MAATVASFSLAQDLTV